MPGTSDFTAFHLELGKSDISRNFGMAKHKSLVDGSGAFDLVIPKLELDEGEPALLVRRPLHPPLEYLSSSGDVAEYLLHVDVLVPELVHAREKRDGSIPDVPGAVHELVLHLELGVL